MVKIDFFDDILIRLEDQGLENNVLKSAIAVANKMDELFQVESIPILFTSGTVPKIPIYSDLHQIAELSKANDEVIEYHVVPCLRNVNDRSVRPIPISCIYNSDNVIEMSKEKDIVELITVKLAGSEPLEEEELSEFLKFNEVNSKVGTSGMSLIADQVNQVDVKVTTLNSGLQYLDYKLSVVQGSIHQHLSSQHYELMNNLQVVKDMILKFEHSKQEQEVVNPDVLENMVIPVDNDLNVNEVINIETYERLNDKITIFIDDIVDCDYERVRIIGGDKHVFIDALKVNGAADNFGDKCGQVLAYYDVSVFDYKVWFCLIAKDKTIDDYDYKALPVIDLIGSASGLSILGVVGVRTLLGSISLLSDDKFDSGFCHGRFGSLARYSKHNNDWIASISNTAGKMLRHKVEFGKITRYVMDSLDKMFSDMRSSDYRMYSRLIVVPSFSDYYGEANGELKLIGLKEEILNDRMVVQSMKNLPSSIGIQLSACVLGCLVSKAKHGRMMYGSLIKRKNGAYVTPCELELQSIKDYWKHPCTVRARCIGLLVTDDSDMIHLPDIKVTNKPKCKICGRVYRAEFEKSICQIFCAIIMKFDVATDSFKNRVKIVKKDPMNYDAIYGEYTFNNKVEYSNAEL